MITTENIIENIEYIRYKDKEISFYGKNLQELLEERNNNLKMIFFEERIKSNYNVIKEGFSKFFPKVDVHFALKSSYIPECLRTLKQIGGNIEVMSDIELQIATQMGFKKNQIISNGLGRKEKELRYSINNSKIILVDNIHDLKLLQKIAKNDNINVDIGLRVIPEIDNMNNESIMIKQTSKLGMELKTFYKAFEMAKCTPELNVKGIQFHQMSHLRDLKLYSNYMREIKEIIINIYVHYQHKFKYVDIGGGFDSRFLLEMEGNSIEDFAQVAHRHLKHISYDFKLVLEPGRFILADSAIITTNVTSKKENRGVKWNIVDAGSNLLIPLPDIQYHAIPIKIPRDDIKWERCNVGDATCAPSIICRDIVLPKECDELVILNCGAYTTVFGELWAFKLPEIYYIDENLNKSNLFSKKNFNELMLNVYGYKIKEI